MRKEEIRKGFRAKVAKTASETKRRNNKTESSLQNVAQAHAKDPQKKTGADNILLLTRRLNG